MECKTHEVVHLLGRKWSILIIDEMARGNFEGFNSFLQKAKNITPRELSLELKYMIESNIDRVQYYWQNW